MAFPAAKRKSKPALISFQAHLKSMHSSKKKKKVPRRRSERTSPIEVIVARTGTVLAYIVRNQFNAEKTSFITPAEATMQLGFVVYPAQGQVARHIHKPIERHLVGTPEFLHVRKGACDITFYDDKKKFVSSHFLEMGDAVLLLHGGHGIKMRQDTVFLEVKRGPYGGLGEKEKF